MKNNSPGTKLLMAAITLVLMTYFGVQAYRYFTDPLSTTLAYTYQVEKEVQLTGYVVRKEQVLAHEEGLLRQERLEGERVSSGGVVATVYADEDSLARQEELDRLTARLEQLQYARDVAEGAEASVKLDSQILQSILTYRRSLAAGKLQEAQNQGSVLRSLVLKRDYTYTDDTGLDEQIQTLEAQIKALKSQSAAKVRQVKAPVSGLFSAVVDGYETVLTPTALADMTPGVFAALTPNETAVRSTGKLILGKDWYYAAVMDAHTAETLQAEPSLALHFTKGVERDLPVTLERIGQKEDGKAVVVFRGSTYLQELTLLRRQSAKVIYDVVEGIRVPKEALRVVAQTTENEDGTKTTTQTTGVYCMVGMEARFKPVEVLYSGEGFVLVRSLAAGETLRLRSGDEVIISARGLYDGKVITE